jgi:hypothetical protein
MDTQPGMDALDAGLVLPVEHEFVRRVSSLVVVVVEPWWSWS